MVKYLNKLGRRAKLSENSKWPGLGPSTSDTRTHHTLSKKVSSMFLGVQIFKLDTNPWFRLNI